MEKIRNLGKKKNSWQLLRALRLSPAFAGLAFGVTAFPATRENSGQDPTSSRSHLTAIDFIGSWRPWGACGLRTLWYSSCREPKVERCSSRGSWAITAPCLLTRKSQCVRITGIFSKTHENHRSLDSLDQSPALGRSKVISYLISQRKSLTH